MSYENETYDDYLESEAKWEREEVIADQKYDTHVDACAHFPEEIWDQVRHMPTAQALMVGDELLEVYNNTVLNKGIADSIWGEERVA